MTDKERTETVNGFSMALTGIGFVLLMTGQFVKSAGVAWNPNHYFQLTALKNKAPEYRENGMCQKTMYYFLSFMLITSGIMVSMAMNESISLHASILWTMGNMTGIVLSAVLLHFNTNSKQWAETNPLPPEAKKNLRERMVPGAIVHALSCASLGLEMAMAHNTDWLAFAAGITAGVCFFFLAEHRLRIETRKLNDIIAGTFWVVSWLAVIMVAFTIPY